MSNTTKNRLKTLSKNNPTHFFRNLSRILKYGLIGFGRNIWLSLTSTIVMTLTLILLFVTIVASLVLSSTAESMREKIDITIYFKPNTAETSLSAMSTIMKSDKNVRTVEYATSAEEYQKFLTETEKTGDVELLETLSDDTMREIMLKSMQSTMRIKVYDAEDLNSVRNIVENDPIFKENLDNTKEPTYDTNGSAIDTIVNWSNIARVGGLALSGLFLLISVLVIFNTIRMAVYSRSEEIYMERLVGADKSFVRGPFLVEAAISGLVAGILGGVISIVTLNAVTPTLQNYEIDVSVISNYINSSNMGLIIACFIGAGILIALVSSRLAVHKYLRKM